MKRLVLILMMLALPMQTTWAAVASYHAHDRGTSSSHFGDHDHQHEFSSKVPSGDPLEGNNAPHADCHFAHLTVFTSVSVSSFLQLSGESLSVGLPPQGYLSFVSAGLDRPNWRVLA